MTAYLDTVPASARGMVARAIDGTASPRLAIKAHCLTCSAFDRAEVADCPVTRCALHRYRPYQSDRKGSKNARGSVSCETSAPAGIQTPPEAQS